MDTKSCKILVCCHKKDVFACEPPYYPIHVGKSRSNLDLGIPGDNTGENISEKNPSYCELTGLYWAWKNLADAEIIGLCHYRRYFDFHNQGRKGFPSTSFKSSSFGSVNLTVPDSILKKVKDGEVVVAKKKNYRYTLFVDYCVCHISDDIRILHNIIRETQPESIQKAFFKIVYQGNRLSHYNMFIMSRNNFDKYCAWLFPLLEEVERRTDITNYNSVQKRIYGYMGERLLNVWLEANKIQSIEKPIIWFNDNVDLLDLYTPFRFRIRSLTNDISHFISKPRQ